MMELLFKDMTVAIVGNSPSILTRKDGQRIDKNDTVVRFNFAEPNADNYESIGTRCDFMICSRGMYAQRIRRRRFASLFPDAPLRTKYAVQGPVRGKGRRICKSRPTSGFVGVLLALHHGATSVQVYGFTGLKDGHWYNPHKFTRGHNGGREFAYLKKLHDAGTIELIQYEDKSE